MRIFWLEPSYATGTQSRTAIPPLGEFCSLEVVYVANRWRPLGDHFVGDQLWEPPPRPQEHRRPPCRGWSRLGVMEGEAARRRRSWKHYNAPNRPFQNPAKTARWRPLGDHFQKSRSPTTRPHSHRSPQYFGCSPHMRPEPDPALRYRLSERSAHSKLSTSQTVGDHLATTSLASNFGCLLLGPKSTGGHRAAAGAA